MATTQLATAILRIINQVRLRQISETQATEALVTLFRKYMAG